MSTHKQVFSPRKGRLLPDELTSGPALRVLGLCALAYLLDGVMNSIIGAVGPGIARSLALGPKALGPVFSAALVGQSIGLLLVSLLPLRIGHRPIVIGSVLAFGLFQTLAGFATGVDQLIALRFLTGIALGGSLPSCMALASEVVVEERRGVAVMTVFVGWALGNSFSGLLAAAFTGPGGWRAAMFTVGAASVLAGAVIWRWLPESPEFLRRKGDVELTGQNPANSLIGQLFSPMLLTGTFLIWVYFICSQITTVSLVSWLPIMLERAGQERSAAALAITAFGGGGLLACIVIGWLIDQFGAVRITLLLTLGAVAGFLLIGGQVTSASRMMLQLEIFTLGFFAQGSYGAINVVVTRHYPVALRATGLGWAKGISRLGAVAGPIFLGFVLATGIAPAEVLRSFAAPEFLAALVLAALGMLNLRRFRAQTKSVTVVE